MLCLISTQTFEDAPALLLLPVQKFVVIYLQDLDLLLTVTLYQ